MNQRATRLISIIAVLLALVGAVVALVVTRPSPPREFVESVSSPADRLTKLVVSADGRHIAAGSAEGHVALMNPLSRRVQHLDAEGESPLTMLTFAPDSLLLSGDQAGQLRGWQPPDYSAVELDEALTSRVTITCAAFRRVSGSLEIILGLADGRLVSIGQDGTSIRESGHRGVKAMLMVEDDEKLVTAGSEGTLRWHRLSDDVVIHSSDGHDTEVSVLAASPDDKTFVSADWNGEIRIWDVESRKIVADVSQPDAVSSLVWQDDHILTGSWDGHIRIFQVADSATTLEHEFDTRSPIHSLTVDPASGHILTVSNDDAIDVWSPDQSAER